MSSCQRILSACCFLFSVKIVSIFFGLLSPDLAGANTTVASSISYQEFNAKSGDNRHSLFREIPAGKSGITQVNQYDDKRIWGSHSRVFLIGAIGTGVAIGDYDSDGSPDLFVVNKTETCRLYRNLGNWNFEDVTEQAGLEDKGEKARIWKQGATFADIDNDGDLDIYVCRFDAPNLLYMNNGDGKFNEQAEARGLALSDASGMASFGDYDRDGWLDVFVVTNALHALSALGRPDVLFRGRGDGTFEDVTEKVGIIQSEDQGHSAIWWDFNEDQWPDLYVGNDFSHPDLFYKNLQNGTLNPGLTRSLPRMPSSTMGLDIGDFNSDGRLDLLATDMAGTTRNQELRGMAESREGFPEFRVDPLTPYQIPFNTVFLSTGTDYFQEAANLLELQASDWTWSVRCEDFDQDGRIDVHVTTGMVRELHNAELKAKMNEARSIAKIVSIQKMMPRFNEKNLAFRNLGDMQFAQIGQEWGLDQHGISFGSATGDLDGDGDLDIVFSNYKQGLTLLRNDLVGGQSIVFELHGTKSNRFGVGATVKIETEKGEQVRQLTLARGYLSSSEPILHFGLGSETEISRATIQWPSGIIQELKGLKAGRKYSIVEEDISDSERTREEYLPQFVDVAQVAGLNFRADTIRIDERKNQPMLPMEEMLVGPSVAIGDLNGDHLEDVIYGGTSETPAILLWAQENGTFKSSEVFGRPENERFTDGPILIFESDGDGLNDILRTVGVDSSGSVRSKDYQSKLYRNLGNGSFQVAHGALPSVSAPVGAVAAADFNRDGKIDLFIGEGSVPERYPEPASGFVLMNMGGVFSDVSKELIPDLNGIGRVSSALWTDVNDDGWLDLLIALNWGYVRYYENIQGTKFEDKTDVAGFSSGGRGWWNSLESADFNGDQRMDYVVGNFGLNSPYRASAAEPIVLYRVKCEPSAPDLIVEALWSDGVLKPRRSRNALHNALKYLGREKITDSQYAAMSLSDLLGHENLDAGRRFEITELRSGVFLSQLDGSFAFQPLPRIAQISTTQGLAAGDFNGDGKADIYALQNSYAPYPETGDSDGGLSQLFKGNGNGVFTPVGPLESGLVVRGDARALVVLDFDYNGWPDFLATRNRLSSIALRNLGEVHGNFLRVALRGTYGNPHALGSRVTLILADGSSQTDEIAAGGGVSSQSSPAVFFGYPDGTLPTEIRVRWPTGQETTTDLPQAAINITINQPN